MPPIPFSHSGNSKYGLLDIPHFNTLWDTMGRVKNVSSIKARWLYWWSHVSYKLDPPVFHKCCFLERTPNKLVFQTGRLADVFLIMYRMNLSIQGKAWTAFVASVSCCCEGSVLSTSNRSYWLTVLFSFISWPIFYLAVLAVVERRVLRSLTVTVDLSLSPFTSLCVCFTCFAVWHMHMYDYCVFLVDWPIYHGPFISLFLKIFFVQHSTLISRWPLLLLKNNVCREFPSCISSNKPN